MYELRAQIVRVYYELCERRERSETGGRVLKNVCVPPQPLFQVDGLDYKTSFLNMQCPSWRYWLTPGAVDMFDATVTMVHQVASDVHELFPEWELGEIESGHIWRDQLAKQMTEYDPKHGAFLDMGESLFRQYTSASKPKRASRAKKQREKEAAVAAHAGAGNVGREHPRLCLTLDEFSQHRPITHTVRRPRKAIHKPKTKGGGSSLTCVACGHLCYNRCSKCDAPLHPPHTGVKYQALCCFVRYHDPTWYGLLRCDKKRNEKAAFVMPTAAATKGRRNTRLAALQAAGVVGSHIKKYK